MAAVERVRLAAFHTNARPSGKPQYHPPLMLALLVYSYANGAFSSRRVERATYRDIGTRFIAANTHPDHDTIASFRRTNKPAFEAAFLQVLLLAREMGLLRLGTVSIDGTKIDANASEPPLAAVRSGAGAAGEARGPHRRVDRQGRGGRCRGHPPAGAAGGDRPARGAQGEARRRPRAVLQAEAKAEAEAQRPQYEARKAAWEAKTGRGGQPPKPPDATPRPDRQTNPGLRRGRL